MRDRVNDRFPLKSIRKYLSYLKIMLNIKETMQIKFIADTLSILENYRGTLIRSLSKSGYKIEKYSIRNLKINH